MALTIKQLNGDTSFLLSLEPIAPPSSSPHLALATSSTGRPFTILLDPWLTGPSKILHPRISLTTRHKPACIASLAELAAPPDLVIISRPQSNHCSGATLRQLPASGTQTLILASPAAAKVVRGWRYFDKDKVCKIPRWEDPHASATGRERVLRVSVPPQSTGGEPGEVTVAFIPQRRGIKGRHAAIGITYRPPPSRRGHNSYVQVPTRSEAPVTALRLITPTWPTLRVSPGGGVIRPAAPPTLPDTTSPLRSVRSTASLTPHARDRAVSVIFSPHGIDYGSLESYATSHLVSEAALPLTALLHCFDDVSGPWWLGGRISSGLPVGQATAAALGARVWISAHDGANRSVTGLVARVRKTRVHGREDVVEALEVRRGGGDDGRRSFSWEASRWSHVDRERVRGRIRREVGMTEVLVLGVGEEVVLTSEGLWGPDEKDEKGGVTV